MNENTIWQTDLGINAQELQIANLGSLAENMVFDLPGCADMMVRKKLQEVFAEFCHKTNALLFNAVVPLKHGVAKYALNAPFNCIVESVVRVANGNRLLRVWRDYTLSDGCPVHVVLPDGFTENIAHFPPEMKTLACRCVLVPRLNSEECPDWFLQKYGYAIRAGAMARLKEMGGRPWADNSQATREMITYTNAMNEACVASASADGSVSGTREIDCFNYGGMIL